MSPKIFSLVLLVLLSLTVCKLRKTTCMALGDDCDFSSYCCGKYQCRDYRCATPETKDNQVAWHTVKCDWFHHCNTGYTCQSHRCHKDI